MVVYWPLETKKVCTMQEGPRRICQELKYDWVAWFARPILCNVKKHPQPQFCRSIREKNLERREGVDQSELGPWVHGATRASTPKIWGFLNLAKNLSSLMLTGHPELHHSLTGWHSLWELFTSYLTPVPNWKCTKLGKIWPCGSDTQGGPRTRSVFTILLGYRATIRVKQCMAKPWSRQLLVKRP